MIEQRGGFAAVLTSEILETGSIRSRRKKPGDKWIDGEVGNGEDD